MLNKPISRRAGIVLLLVIGVAAIAATALALPRKEVQPVFSFSGPCPECERISRETRR